MMLTFFSFHSSNVVESTVSSNKLEARAKWSNEPASSERRYKLPAKFWRIVMRNGDLGRINASACSFTVIARSRSSMEAAKKVGEAKQLIGKLEVS